MSELGTSVFQSTVGGTRMVFEGGTVAQRADGAVVGRQGNTVILATVVSAQEATDDQSFLPLTVDYREKLAAAGRIPGGYLRREARPTEDEIRTSRLIDRTLRSLFPEGYLHTTQVTITVLSHDPESDPQVLAINTAAAALMCSDIPWNGPAAGVRVGRRGDDFELFPSRSRGGVLDVELVASFSRTGLIMVEGYADQVPDHEFIALLQYARHEANSLLDTQEELRAAIEPGERVWASSPASEEIQTQLTRLWHEQLGPLTALLDARDRNKIKRAMIEEAENHLSNPLSRSRIDALFHRFVREILRRTVLHEKRRIDGRGVDEVRQVSGGVGVLPGAHGSSLFTRGGTQALVTCTLGTAREELEHETLDGVKRERFYVHYNFPRYSVGEPGQIRGPGRREIGHGALARRAIIPVLPASGAFPYTIRLDTEITQSDGSSSMATICGGSLALMDAGVPISAPVAGVAMGLIGDEEKTVVLTDIAGDEDHSGDMDFKIAGTAAGVTALQMDTKIGALPDDVLSSVFEKARVARLHILDEMAAILSSPRSELGNRGPRIRRITVDRRRVRDLIGPGGRTIQELQNTTGAKIELEKGGSVTVSASDTETLRVAIARIRDVTSNAKLGEIYRGTVVGVHEFGTVVRFLGSVEGLVSADEAPPSEHAVGSRLLVRTAGVDRRGRIVLTVVTEEEESSRRVMKS